MTSFANIRITKHAIDRLRQRWKLLYGYPAPFHAVKLIRSLLASSRLKRITSDVAFYSNYGFEFVIRNGALVTITIELNQYKYLNAA